MIFVARPADPERVSCEVCGKEVPRSVATSARDGDKRDGDNTVFFCGPVCLWKWHERNEPRPEVQFGQGRSSSRDERLKRLIRPHSARAALEAGKDSATKGESS